MTSAINSQIWHDRNGNLLTITTDPHSGLVEVQMQDTTIEKVHLEVLQQARDAMGLAIGPTVKVFETQIVLIKHSDNQSSSGRIWLPQQLVRHFREYFYRLTK
jgi:hypothetical protein